MFYYSFFNIDPPNFSLYSFEIPEQPAQYKAQDIKRIREQNHYSQYIFAKVLNVSVKTIQSWESGTSAPSRAALRLLEVVDKGFYCPRIVKRICEC